MKTKIKLIFLVLAIIAVITASISFSGFSYTDRNAVIEYYAVVDKFNEEHERHYTTINGIKSESYYDVFYENGEIWQINYSQSNIAKIILPIRVFETNEPPQTRVINGNTFNLVKCVYSQIMYYNLNKRMVPVETNIYCYKFDGLSEYKGVYVLNSDNELVIPNDGYVGFEICYNLYDGSEINYSTLNKYERIIGY